MAALRHARAAELGRLGEHLGGVVAAGGEVVGVPEIGDAPLRTSLAGVVGRDARPDISAEVVDVRPQDRAALVNVRRRIESVLVGGEPVAKGPVVDLHQAAAVAAIPGDVATVALDRRSSAPARPISPQRQRKMSVSPTPVG